MAEHFDIFVDYILPTIDETSSSGGAGRKFDMKRKVSCEGASGFRNGRAGGVSRDKNRGDVSKPNYTKNRSNGTRLQISNLHIGVSDLDIQKLFSEFGILKMAAVNYDRLGRSLGTADVVFKNRADAFKAILQCDGMLLGGLAMKIQWVVLTTSEINMMENEGGGRRVRGGGVVKRKLNGSHIKNTKQSGGSCVNRNAHLGRGGAAHIKRLVPTAEHFVAEFDGIVKEMCKMNLCSVKGVSRSKRPVPIAKQLDAELDEIVKEMKLCNVKGSSCISIGQN